MSRIETHIGKLKPLPERNSDNIENWIKERCIEQNISKQSHHDSWLDAWNDNHYGEVGYVIMVKDKYYEVIEDVDIEENDISFIVDKNGIYSYVMQYHNSGTCFSEMLEESILDSIE